MTIPDQTLEEAKAKGINESTLRARYMVEQDARQVIIRLSANGQVHPAIQGRTVDANFGNVTQAHLTTPQPVIDLDSTKQQSAPVSAQQPARSTANQQPNATEVSQPASQFMLKKIDPAKLESSKINPDDPHSMVTGNTRFDDRQMVDMEDFNTDVPPDQAVINKPEDLPPPSAVELLRYFSTNSQFERDDKDE